MMFFLFHSKRFQSAPTFSAEMSSVRKRRQEALQKYNTETFRDMKTVKSFIQKRKEILKILEDADIEMDTIQRGTKKCMNPANCCRSFLRWFLLWVVFLGCQCCCCAEVLQRWTARRVLPEEVEKGMEKMTTKERTSKLKAALGDVQQQLENLQGPLQAMERLAVTSEQVFEQDLQEQVDLRGVDLRAVRRVLSVVKAVSPWLTVFKQDQIFKLTLENNDPQSYQQSLPRYAATAQRNTLRDTLRDTLENTLENTLETIEPLQLRLQAFISALKNICRLLQDSALMELQLDQAEVRVSGELSEEQADKIQKLQEIRDSEDCRLVFLLGDQAQMSTEELREREPQMSGCVGDLERCVKDLERCAEKLNYMSTGRLVSAVVSSFVGAVGGVVSLTGLGLMTFTLREASILLWFGFGGSAFSGAISLATLIADWWENRKWKMKANSVSEQLKGHMKALQRCLNSATFSPTERIPEQDQTTSGICIGSKGVLLVRSADIISDVITKTTAAEEADFLKALTSPWTKSKFSPLFGFTTNSLFLYMDLRIISHNIWVLCKEKHTPAAAQWLTARAALWEADVEDWKKIRDSLKRGQPRAESDKHLHSALY